MCSLGVKTKQAENLRDDLGYGPFGGYLLRNQPARSGEKGQLHAVGKSTPELGIRTCSYLGPLPGNLFCLSRLLSLT